MLANVRQATAADFDAILALQAANTPERLGKEAAAQQGYIVSQMDKAQLQRINERLGIFIAERDGRMLGFVCLQTIDSRPRPPMVDALLQVTENVSFEGRPLAGRNSFLYGPICLDAAARGQGLARRLFEVVRQRMHDRFEVGLAFIAGDNPHSLAVHVRGLGMTDVASFDVDGKPYRLIAFAV